MKKIAFIVLLALTCIKANAQQQLTIDYSSDCSLDVTIYVFDPLQGCNNLYSTTFTLSPGAYVNTYILPSLSWMGPTSMFSGGATIDHIILSQGTSCGSTTVGYGGCAGYPMNSIVPACSPCNADNAFLSGPPNNANLICHHL